MARISCLPSTLLYKTIIITITGTHDHLLGRDHHLLFHGMAIHPAIEEEQAHSGDADQAEMLQYSRLARLNLRSIDIHSPFATIVDPKAPITV
mmetsp:Transcript_3983/g.8083  ORF Transcript_3983/g.8083 Transcript_3983/m.8083 type:complete len:93 (+) Transcript_3983:145-423(+)